LYQGDLKELGRVDNLLKVSGETDVRTKGLSQAAQDEIREVIKRHGGELISIENPRTTLEELFLNIVRESQARPGRRSAGVESAEPSENGS
jgi:ABC-2 type transport system ATP-binding protein